MFNGELTCPCCLNPFSAIGKYQLHHKLPIEFGRETNKRNLIPICIPCHHEITKYVNSNSKMIWEYVYRDLIEIPDEYSDRFK